MEDIFVGSKVDSKPLTIDRTLFLPHEGNKVEDIPGLDSMPTAISDTFLRHLSCLINLVRTFAYAGEGGS